MWRSIRAVAAGFILIFVLSMATDRILAPLFPKSFGSEGAEDSVAVLLLILLYVAVFAVLGCYVTARLAPKRPMWHALVLGGLGLVFNLAGLFASWNTAPVWYDALGIGLVMPYAWLGGYIRERELLRRSAARPV